MRRPQFTIRTLMVLMLVAAAFFGGIKFERERRIREERASRVPIDLPPLAGSSAGITGGNTTPGFDFNNPTLSTPARKQPAPMGFDKQNG